MVQTGEALTPSEQMRTFVSAVRERVLHNRYGPAETHVVTSHSLVAGDVWPASVPIGRPLWNTDVYLLDEFLELVPFGVAGEVFLSGAGVARGYLGRAGLTAEQFIPDPFAQAGTRMYRTGDLGRWSSKGVLEFLGRVDRKVKVRGFRIEPAEVEACLRAIPDVAQAAVLVREELSGPILVAYVVAVGAAQLNPVQMRAWLNSQLPEFMVPSAFVVVAELPLSPNGKLDVGALPAVGELARVSGAEYGASF